VLQFWNQDVINHIDEVLNVIWNVLYDKERGHETFAAGLRGPPNRI
jgi:hypothetical protein